MRSLTVRAGAPSSSACDETVEVAVDPAELRPGALARSVALPDERVDVAGVFLAEHRHEVRVHQPALQSLEDGGLQVVPAHGGLVGAGAFVPSVHDPMYTRFQVAPPR